MAKQQLETKLADAAHTLIEWITSLDPTWRQKIDIALAEYGFTEQQLIGNWIGFVLDTDNHTAVSARPEFQPDFQPALTERVCDACEKPFRAKFAGQRWCELGGCPQGAPEPFAAHAPDVDTLTD